jgi:transposase
LEKKCQEYPATQTLRQIGGVGPVIALTFCLLVHDPNRFRNGRQVAAYFGLVPRRDQSGEVDKQLSITKAGSSLMRWALIQGANYIMGQGKACDLRRFGERIGMRGGSIAKRKAKVAVARKLCVVMLTLWRNSEVPYDPEYRSNRKKKTA